MDLTQFTNKKKEDTKSEIILDNKDIKVIKYGEEVEFIVKNEKALEKYQNFLFASPSQAIKTENKKKAQEFFEQSLNDGVEGLMFKSPKSPYKPGLRSGAMAKLKETKEDIDVVIVAAEFGKGKRAGYYSSFFVAIRNQDSTDTDDEFLEIGKVSSGIKELDEQGASLKKLTQLLEPLKYKEEKSISYFEPKIIIQVKYQEIQKSTSYSSGYALRFPRIITLREDKDVNEINTLEDIKKFSSI